MRFLFALLDSLAKRVCVGEYKNVTKEQSVGIRMQRMSDVTGKTKNSVIESRLVRRGNLAVAKRQTFCADKFFISSRLYKG